MSATIKNPPDWPLLVESFGIHGHFVSAVPYGSGHINDTYALTVDQAGTSVRYLLQRINHRIFTDVPALMENISRVTAHALAQLRGTSGQDRSRRVLTLVHTRFGQSFYYDFNGGWWRCYLFIEKASTHDIIREPQQAREAARAFGGFQRILTNLPGPRLDETIIDFHHTRKRFDRLRQAVVRNSHGRLQSALPEITFANDREHTVDRLTDLARKGDLPERITHNDTKLNNVMLDDATGEGICVIDLDTVMPGLAPYDFGDMVRTATNPVAEDETNLSKVVPRLSIFEALAEGYLQSAGGFLNAAEVNELVFAGRLMTFEVGIRFLTDYLEGDVYFKTKRSDHNLDRARNQFALLRGLEAQTETMEAIVKRFARP